MRAGVLSQVIDSASNRLQWVRSGTTFPVCWQANRWRRTIAGAEHEEPKAVLRRAVFRRVYHCKVNLIVKTPHVLVDS
jgi:hypothetical protein